MNRVFITGDTHGDFNRIVEFCEETQTDRSDILIILGDAGINYYLGKKDYNLKKLLSSLPITFFCIHGNHEERPQNIESYELKYKFIVDGKVYCEKEFPNILFAKDDTIYEIGDKYYYVLGGAYSVDKLYRLAKGYKWFESEQDIDLIGIIDRALRYDEWAQQISSYSNLTILTHTCPYKYTPIEAFLPMIDQSSIDKTMEHLLDKLENKVTYKDWYCGHWHINKDVDKMHFLFDSIIEVGK